LVKFIISWYLKQKTGERPGGLRGDPRKLLPSSTGFGAATRGERSPALEQKRYPTGKWLWWQPSGCRRTPG